SDSSCYRSQLRQIRWVSEPSGSPLARASAEGVGMLVRSLSVMATGGVAGAAAAGASGAAAGGVAGAWAHASDTIMRVTANNAMRRVMFMILSSVSRSLSPGRLFLKAPVDQSDNPSQADGQPDEDDHHAAAYRRTHSKAGDRDNKAQKRN